MKETVLDEQTIKEVCSRVTSIADFCREVGWKPQGANYRIFHKYVKRYNLDISHFTGQRTNIGNKLNAAKVISNEELFSNRPVSVRSKVLIDRLLKGKYKEYCCEKCGISNWQGKVLNLQLHHVNGDHFNNSLDNLQLLCPNCHSQTDSFSGKKNKGKKIVRRCKNCNKVLNWATKLNLCRNCYVKLQQSYSKKPDKETLIEQCKIYGSYVQVSKKFNVSDNTVKKWCKSYGFTIKDL